MTISTEYTEDHGHLVLNQIKRTEGTFGQRDYQVSKDWELYCTLCDEFLATALPEAEARQALADAASHGRQCRCSYQASGCRDLADHINAAASAELDPSVIHADVW